MARSQTVATMHPRGRFLRNAAMTIAAAELASSGAAIAQSETNVTTITPFNGSPTTSFPSLKQISAGALNVGYAETGPSDGTVAILLHGWPYDIYSYVDVAPILASAGYRVIVPFLRGYGSTTFL